MSGRAVTDRAFTVGARGECDVQAPRAFRLWDFTNDLGLREFGVLESVEGSTSTRRFH